MKTQTFLAKRLILATTIFLTPHGFAVQSLDAQQPPIQEYGINDGLSHNRVECIVRDSRGFLWFCTYDGLSRFDGRKFTTYNAAEGLNHPRVNDVLEDRSGAYWLATTGGGVVRLEPAGSRPDVAETRFIRYPSRQGGDQPAFPSKLLQDREGHVWVSGLTGLYRLDHTDAGGSFQPIALRLPTARGPTAIRIEAGSLAEDPTGSLWIGSSHGLFRRLPDGRILHYSIQLAHAPEAMEEAELARSNRIWTLIADDQGRIWLANRFGGLLVLAPEPLSAASISRRPHPESKATSRRLRARPCRSTDATSSESTLHLPTEPGDLCRYTTADGLSHDDVRVLFEDEKGLIWIGTNGGGVTSFDGHRFHSYSEEQGIAAQVSSLADDSAGNLWIGTPEGAQRLSPGGAVSYQQSEGLPSSRVLRLFETVNGELCVVSAGWHLSLFDGRRFRTVRPRLPANLLEARHGAWQVIQDHLGDWWVATAVGLYRFPRVESFEQLRGTPPRAVYTTRDGLPDNVISRVFEDSRGDVWISSYHPPIMLARWRRATNTIHHYGPSEGLPDDNWANTFAEDAAGQLWLGLHNGGLARHRAGFFELFGESEGVPSGMIGSLYSEPSGRLWAATNSSGAGRIDEPTTEHPRVEAHTMHSNLASNNLCCFAADGAGQVYVGTARGLDRLHLATGRVRHYTVADGLPSSEVTAVTYRPGDGAVWIGTNRGVSQLLPEADRRQAAPEVWINRLRLGGVDQPLLELGQREVKGLVLRPHQRQIEVEFFTLDFTPGRRIRYQHQLEGADGAWSEPTAQRSLTVHLAPGRYRLNIRAVRDDGATSIRPAAIALRILPPLWRRRWFLTLAAVLLLAAAELRGKIRIISEPGHGTHLCLEMPL